MRLASRAGLPRCKSCKRGLPVVPGYSECVHCTGLQDEFDYLSDRVLNPVAKVTDHFTAYDDTRFCVVRQRGRLEVFGLSSKYNFRWVSWMVTERGKIQRVAVSVSKKKAEERMWKLFNEYAPKAQARNHRRLERRQRQHQTYIARLEQQKQQRAEAREAKQKAEREELVEALWDNLPAMERRLSSALETSKQWRRQRRISTQWVFTARIEEVIRDADRG